MLNIEEIREAQRRIAPYIVKTPLLRMPMLDERLGCQAYIKADNMQVTSAFKIRGALNAILSIPQEKLKSGVVCASSGNHGRGVSYGAKMLGIPATVVMPDTATQVKIDAIRALGAEVVSCRAEERFDVAEKISRETGAEFIPPFNDERVMAGQGTAGLEIAEQQPDLDCVVVPVSGGGLISGISTALRAAAPEMKIYGAEPARIPRYTRSLEAGKPVFVSFQKTIADALVSSIPGDKCFPVVQKNVDQVVDVSDDYVLRAMKLLLLTGKILAEPSSCIGIAAVLEGLIPVRPDEKVCFFVSGGSVGLSQLKVLEDVEA